MATKAPETGHTRNVKRGVASFSLHFLRLVRLLTRIPLGLEEGIRLRAKICTRSCTALSGSHLLSDDFLIKTHLAGECHAVFQSRRVI
jgi:hypothetical protein